jgi:GT2 family glycosyltransferase
VATRLDNQQPTDHNVETFVVEFIAADAQKDVLMSQPLVSMVVVNYNGLAHLETFLDAARAQDYPAASLEIIVVDNGSSDGSVKYLRQHHPMVRVIENSQNRGFAEANNQGALLAAGRYLALLNNDMRMAPDWIRRMVEHLEAAGTDVVCAGGRILSWDGQANDFIGGAMAFNGMGAQPGFGTPAGEPAEGYPSELLFACGGSMVIEREVYLRVGGFDADYFAYFEDVDLGWRLWVLGYRVTFCPTAVTYHRSHGTASRFQGYKRTVLYERNALCSMVKNYDDEALRDFLAAALLLSAKRIAVRAGVPRPLFDFTGPTGMAPLRSSGGPPLRSFLAFWKREGTMLAFTRAFQVLWIMAHRLFERQNCLISRDSYAAVAALEDLIDLLPALMAKRRKIQALRQRPDTAIMPLLRDPLAVGATNAEYARAHDTILRAFKLTERFDEAGKPHASDTVDTLSLIS